MDRPSSLNDFSYRAQVFLTECLRQGETLPDLATQAGVTIQTLTRIKSGQTQFPNSRTILALDEMAQGFLLTGEERAYVEQVRAYFERKYGAGRA